MNSDHLLDAMGEIRPEYIMEAKQPAPIRRRPVLRALIAAALAAFCLSASVCAMTAADVDPAYELLYRVSPAAAQLLKPVHRSCTDQGLRVEVVSADVRGDAAEICVGVTDLEGERVDGTLDLFDSCTIRTGHDSMGGCEFLRYDPDAGTALFLISIRHLDGAPIRRDKVTFSVTRMLTNKGEWTGELPLRIDPAPAILAEGTYEERGFSAVYDPEHPDEPAKEIRPVHLKPDLNADEITPGVRITAMGLVGDRLHVQAHYDDILRTDNHGWVWLERPDGTRIDPVFDASFWDGDHRGSFEEYEFELTAAEAAECRLMGEFTTCRSLVEGNWEITFPVE